MLQPSKILISLGALPFLCEIFLTESSNNAFHAQASRRPNIINLSVRQLISTPPNYKTDGPDGFSAHDTGTCGNSASSLQRLIDLLVQGNQNETMIKPIKPGDNEAIPIGCVNFPDSGDGVCASYTSESEGSAELTLETVIDRLHLMHEKGAKTCATIFANRDDQEQGRIEVQFKKQVPCTGLCPEHLSTKSKRGVVRHLGSKPAASGVLNRLSQGPTDFLNSKEHGFSKNDRVFPEKQRRDDDYDYSLCYPYGKRACREGQQDHTLKSLIQSFMDAGENSTSYNGIEEPIIGCVNFPDSGNGICASYKSVREDILDRGTIIDRLEELWGPNCGVRRCGDVYAHKIGKEYMDDRIYVNYMEDIAQNCKGICPPYSSSPVKRGHATLGGSLQTRDYIETMSSDSTLDKPLSDQCKGHHEALPDLIKQLSEESAQSTVYGGPPGVYYIGCMQFTGERAGLCVRHNHTSISKKDITFNLTHVVDRLKIFNERGNITYLGDGSFTLTDSSCGMILLHNGDEKSGYLVIDWAECPNCHGACPAREGTESIQCQPAEAGTQSTADPKSKTYEEAVNTSPDPRLKTNEEAINTNPDHKEPRWGVTAIERNKSGDCNTDHDPLEALIHNLNATSDLGKQYKFHENASTIGCVHYKDSGDGVCATYQLQYDHLQLDLRTVIQRLVTLHEAGATSCGKVYTDPEVHIDLVFVPDLKCNGLCENYDLGHKLA